MKASSPHWERIAFSYDSADLLAQALFEVDGDGDGRFDRHFLGRTAIHWYPSAPQMGVLDNSRRGLRYRFLSRLEGRVSVG